MFFTTAIVVLFCFGAGEVVAEERQYDYLPASEKCPCIDPWSMADIPQKDCPDGLYFVSEAMGCVPYGFGADECRPWLRDPEKNFNASSCRAGSDSCDSKWCFVDANDCERPFSYVTDLSGLTGTNVGWSLETCGNVDLYSHNRVMLDIINKTLRVSYPGDSSDGYTLATNEDGGRVGSTVDLMNDIFKTYNISAKVTNLTQKSKDVFTSSYTQCVHDIALNETDLCIGAFWTTNQRLLLSSFTTAVYQDAFYLITYEDSVDTSFLTLMKTPLIPFTTGAWLRLAVVVLYMSSSIYVVQRCANEQELEAEDSITNVNNVSSTTRFFQHLGNSSFYGITSMAKGEVTSESEEPTVAEKFIIAGFMVFALIVLTAYTASSAAALVLDDSGPTYLTLNDVYMDSPAGLCIEEAVFDVFTGLFKEWSNPKSIGRIKRFGNVTSILNDGMDGGDCVAAVIKEDAYVEIMTDPNMTHCNKVKTTGLVLTISNAFPVNEVYAKAFGYAVGERVNSGLYENLRQKSSDILRGDPFCNDDNFVSEDSSFDTLDENDLMAPIFISISTTTIGLLICFVPKWSQRISSVQNDHADTSDIDSEDNKTTKTVQTDLEQEELKSFNPTFAELLEILKDAPKKEVDEAMEMLPDESRLLLICLHNHPHFKSSPDIAEIIMKMTWNDILWYCKKVTKTDIFEGILRKPNAKLRLRLALLSYMPSYYLIRKKVITDVRLFKSTASVPKDFSDSLFSNKTVHFDKRGASSESVNERRNPNSVVMKPKIDNLGIVKDLDVIYLSCGDVWKLKRIFESYDLNDTLDTDEKVISRITVGSMSPNEGKNSIQVLEIILSSADFIEPIILIFLKMHDCTLKRKVEHDHIHSFVLTAEARIAKLVKKVIRNFESELEDTDKVLTFVGKSGIFRAEESNTSNVT